MIPWQMFYEMDINAIYWIIGQIFYQKNSLFWLTSVYVMSHLDRFWKVNFKISQKIPKTESQINATGIILKNIVGGIEQSNIQFTSFPKFSDISKVNK